MTQKTIIRQQRRSLEVIHPVQLDSDEATDVSVYDHRILYLSGRWRKSGSEFMLNATIYVSLSGLSDGMIAWDALRVHGVLANYSAIEWVNGFVRGRDVELDGYEVEQGLEKDSYRITLSGNDKAGIFSGISRTYLNNWCGRMEGKYLFEDKEG